MYSSVQLKPEQNGSIRRLVLADGVILLLAVRMHNNGVQVRGQVRGQTQDRLEDRKEVLFGGETSKAVATRSERSASRS
jgi:hypothetical protein